MISNVVLTLRSINSRASLGREPNTLHRQTTDTQHQPIDVDGGISLSTQASTPIPPEAPPTCFIIADLVCRPVSCDGAAPAGAHYRGRVIDHSNSSAALAGERRPGLGYAYRAQVHRDKIS
jgi:hypothetical protein